MLSRPATLVRLEGVPVLALALLFYGRHEGGWLLFAVLFFAPDVSIAGYALGPRIGAAAYNLLHTYSLAVLIAIYGEVGRSDLAISLALILAAHIAVDRVLGFGLKYPTAFADTHLQRL